MERFSTERNLEGISDENQELLKKLDTCGYLFTQLKLEDQTFWFDIEEALESDSPEEREKALQNLPELLRRLEKVRLSKN